MWQIHIGSQWPLQGLSNFSFFCNLPLVYHWSHNRRVACILCPSSINKPKDLNCCWLSIKKDGKKDDGELQKSNSWYQIFSWCISDLHHPILYWDWLPGEEWDPSAIFEQNISVIIIPPVSTQRSTHIQKISIFSPGPITGNPAVLLYSLKPYSASKGCILSRVIC